MVAISGERRRLRRTGSMAIAIAAVALAAGACSSNDAAKKTVASVAPTSSAAAQAPASKGDLVAFARCMRQNGLTNFPDPDGTGLTLPHGMSPNAPAYVKAESKCKQYEPSGPKVQGTAPADNSGVNWSPADKLKYAKCMRDNGVPKFPDPDSTGGFVLTQESGIDPNSTVFKKAQGTCKKYQPQALQGAPGGPGVPN